MTLTYAERLKARRGGGFERKKPKELKLNATKRVRGKLHYWNPYTKSWSKTKVIRKVEVKKEKPLTRAEQLKKGMATWDTEKGNQAVGSPKWDEKGNKKEKKKVVNKEEKKVVVQNKKENKQGNEEKVEKVAKTENKEKLKVPRYVRNKKTKTLVSTKTNKGKQLLKLEERKRKLREKRFGKK